MELKDLHSKKELIKNNDVLGEKIEGDNMTDIIGYSPLNITLQDIISAGYIQSMNILKRVIHDIENDEQLKIFESYIVPYYRRMGIDFMDAYNEVRQKIFKMNENIKNVDNNIKNLPDSKNKNNQKNNLANEQKQKKEQSENT